MKQTRQSMAKLAFRFVLIIGIANFFPDMSYEGARSVVGPFLGSLGASAAIVGFVAGFGEMVGYGLRSVSGYFADKTHRLDSHICRVCNQYAGFAIPGSCRQLASNGFADCCRANRASDPPTRSGVNALASW